MQIRLSRKDLLAGLTLVARAVPTRASNPVLSCVLLAAAADTLELTGTNLDITISTRVPIEPFGTAGIAVVPASVLIDVIRVVDSDTIDLSLGADDRLAISGGKSSFRLAAQSVDDWPKTQHPTGSSFVLAASDVVAILNQVVLAAADSVTRPLLSGILVHTAAGSGVTFVATDSHRLVTRNFDTDMPAERIIIPGAAATELVRVLGADDKVKVTLGESRIWFETDSTLFSSSLLDGAYPPYQAILGIFDTDHGNCCHVNRTDLMAAVKRVTVVDKSRPVRISFDSPELVTLESTSDQGSVSDNLDAIYTGSPMTIAFNGEHMVEALKTFTTEEVVFTLVSPLKLVRITGMDDPHVHYLMPRRT